MIGQVFALSTLVALSQAKVIVSNHCQKDVYVWSVPFKSSLSSLADGLSVSPGKSYQEPFRNGTKEIPGIAIKISTDPHGVAMGKDEIDFQYNVEGFKNATRIWIALTNVRGNEIPELTLNTCHGPSKGPNVGVQQCWSTDDIEPVLCGSKRTVPARDTTPPHVISHCIGLREERVDPVQARQCSGRVVGSRRPPFPHHHDTHVPFPHHHDANRPFSHHNDTGRPCPHHNDTDEHLAEPSDTIPLQTIMRLEAAKHAASQAAEAHGDLATRSTESTSICDLLHESWPDAQCDEKIAKHNAMLFYDDNCDKKTRDMFPGTNCESIRREIEKIYPDVLTKREHKTMCVNKARLLLGLFWGDVKATLNGLFPDRSWTSDEEICNGHNQTVPNTESRTRRCVEPFCAFYCSEIEDALEEISLDAGKNIDWTTSDDECGDKRSSTMKRTAGNTEGVAKGEHETMCIEKAYSLFTASPIFSTKPQIRAILNSEIGAGMFPDRSWTSDEEVCGRSNHTVSVNAIVPRTRRCVEPFCAFYCSEIEDALEEISLDAGKDIDWTSTDEECEKTRSSTAPRAVFNIFNTFEGTTATATHNVSELGPPHVPHYSKFNATGPPHVPHYSKINATAKATMAAHTTEAK